MSVRRGMELWCKGVGQVVRVRPGGVFCYVDEKGSGWVVIGGKE